MITMSVSSRRGEATWAERSVLGPRAQLLQNLLDRMACRMAGLDDDITGLKHRLAGML